MVYISHEHVRRTQLIEDTLGLCLDLICVERLHSAIYTIMYQTDARTFPLETRIDKYVGINNDFHYYYGGKTPLYIIYENDPLRLKNTV